MADCYLELEVTRIKNTISPAALSTSSPPCIHILCPDLDLWAGVSTLDTPTGELTSGQGFQLLIQQQES